MRVSPSRGKVAALLGALLLVIAGGVALRLTWSDLLLWRRLSPQFTLHRWKNGQGYPEYRHRETGIIFVHLPGGTFRMGAIEDEALTNSGMDLQLHPAVRDSLAAKLPAADRAPEYPPHAVTLSPFLIAKYEVSQAEWEKVTGTNPSDFKGDRLPVENVSWLEALRKRIEPRILTARSRPEDDVDCGRPLARVDGEIAIDGRRERREAVDLEPMRLRDGRSS